VHYVRRPELETADEKLAFLARHPMRGLPFDEVQPDKTGNWLNLTNNDFETLIPLASKETKAAKTAAKERAIFKLFTQGVKTNRDEWVCGFAEKSVAEKTSYLIARYNSEVTRLSGSANSSNVADLVDYEIKWTRKLKNLLVSGRALSFDSAKVRKSLYRPFTEVQTYFAWELNEDWYQLAQVFPDGVAANPHIAFVEGQRLSFGAIASDKLPNYAIFSLDPAQCAFLYRFDSDGQRQDNITDWALKQFTAHYKTPVRPEPVEGLAEASTGSARTVTGSTESAGPGAGKARKITKEAIFHYCYAVLHDPVYREKYAQNLKREFPRIPFYPGFWRWADWGAELMRLHIGYEAVEPFPLTRTDTPDEKARAAGLPPKAVLRADPAAGCITLDTETTLRGIPPEAWTYKLGNRCALDWVLDQYKEKKPKDPTIREKFDTYRFADHKEKVIDLLARVTRVSVETVRIVGDMKAAGR
jgi:predicted helicase